MKNNIKSWPPNLSMQISGYVGTTNYPELPYAKCPQHRERTYPRMQPYLCGCGGLQVGVFQNLEALLKNICNHQIPSPPLK